MTSHIKLLKSFAELCLDILFPKQCVRCFEYGTYLCIDCFQNLEVCEGQRCIVCQKPSLAGFTHPKCSTKYTPERLVTLFKYQDPIIAKLISIGKYQFVKEIFSLVASRSLKNIKQLLPSFESFGVCPIPLHAKKLRWRGFNQAEVLANTLALGLNLSVVKNLKRIKFTAPQKDLDAEQRKVNIKETFVFEVDNFSGQSILLIDDITTTGSTFLSASKAIKLKTKIEVVCLAITQD